MACERPWIWHNDRPSVQHLLCLILLSGVSVVCSWVHACREPKVKLESVSQQIWHLRGRLVHQAWLVHIKHGSVAPSMKFAALRQVMLLSDGSVTRHLQLLTDLQVQVVSPLCRSAFIRQAFSSFWRRALHTSIHLQCSLAHTFRQTHVASAKSIHALAKVLSCCVGCSMGC